MDKNHPISNEIKAFLIDRRAGQCSPRTIEYYQYQLEYYLLKHLTDLHVSTMEELTPDVLREFLAWHGEKRGEGGVHACWRAVKAFLNWYDKEAEGQWKNPARKVHWKAPKPQPIPGIKPEDLERMVETCDRSAIGKRDRALLLFMLDSGLRRNEVVALDMTDLNLDTGEVRVQHGKGDKARSVYIGAKTRREISRYLRVRPKTFDKRNPLWVTQSGGRITPSGLRQVIRRRALAAGIKEEPSPHDFRRAFAISCLRNGMDPYTLRRLMGHTSLKVLEVYLDQNQEDLQRGHGEHGPVDNLD